MVVTPSPPAEDGPGSSQASPSHGGKSRRGSFGKETMETSGYKTERAAPQWRQAAPANLSLRTFGASVSSGSEGNITSLIFTGITISWRKIQTGFLWQGNNGDERSPQQGQAAPENNQFPLIRQLLMRPLLLQPEHQPDEAQHEPDEQTH
ncbi:hypothetical protein DAPPUDRAFT_110783 [Daphnia pulex]|uniref:Uncharacterized protein n=1 Tax=Daphnia pulex TaxID=6669 RepID=E9H759_DAPPU|nr:hypothetical protein DAPPUDRAFT_110783 [Daphnia pulex]|eukprot:EFX72319.1 hypothetical protein DAPPUDRAFT_110783 [Daphnia pulex]